MPFYEINDTMRQVAGAYQRDAVVLKNLIGKRDLFNTLKTLKIPGDARDFAPILLAMGIEGNTPEERDADIERKLDQITEAFMDQNPEKRKPYLDAIYDLRDTFDPEAVDMNNPEDVWKLISYCQLGQTYGTERKENLEYYSHRYPTEVEQNFASVANVYMDSVGALLLTELRENNIQITTGITLVHGTPKEQLPYAKIVNNFARRQLEDAKKTLDGNEFQKEYVFSVTDAMMSLSGKKPEDAFKLKEAESNMCYDHFNLCVDNTILRSENKELIALHEADLFTKEVVFIDGKPWSEYAKELFPDKKILATKEFDVLTLALMSNEHRVEMLDCTKLENGEMKLDVKPIKIQFTPEQEKLHLKNNHNWFRRTFFNWGPFRIETLQEKADRLAANDTQKAERHEQMRTSFKEKFNHGVQEKERKAKANAEKEKIKKLNYERDVEAAKKLENSVEKWDKESVIGILGEQVKNGYGDVRKSLQLHNGRMEKASVSIAKLVVYGMLMQERAANAANGIKEPGTMEKKILGDGSRETIEKNLDNAVDQIAKDQTFRDFLLDTIGEDLKREGRTITKAKFDEVYLRNGGFEKLTSDYVQRRNGEKVVTGTEINQNIINNEKKFDEKSIVEPKLNI